jgi:hypothetical protein
MDVSEFSGKDSPPAATSPAKITYETMGNAIVLVNEGDRPLLVADPWITGGTYFGSWKLDHPLTREQLDRILGSKFLWISHGHPDHMHPDSLALFARDTTILLGKHYSDDIERFFKDQGFKRVIVCPNKNWVTLSPNLRIQCICNINQDTILIVEAGKALVINLNDSPLFGDGPYLRKLVGGYDKTYLLALCAYDADMINIVDEKGERVTKDPEERKPGTIGALARRAEYLGVQTYCCSSSQHIYVRRDSAWANPFRITWDDMKRYWTSKKVKLVEAFVTVDVHSGAIQRNHPSQQSDFNQVTDGTADDDWTTPMSAEDWRQLERFVLQFETLRPKLDFVEFVVGGETRRFYFSEAGRRRRPQRQRGLVFEVPRNSLMDTVTYGFFDDLLIGNFMRTRLVNMTLYPDFSPRIAKYGGNAKVYKLAELREFYWHYFRESPRGFVAHQIETMMQYYVIPTAKDLLRRIGLFDTAKASYRRLVRRA